MELGVQVSRSGAMLGVASYVVALLVFAMARQAGQEPIPSLFLAMAGSGTLYGACRPLAFGPKRDPHAAPDEDERSVRIAIGIAGALVALTALMLFGPAIASAIGLLALMPIYLAVYVFYDSKARPKPASGRR